jgi:FkbM family methyltransferase
MLGNVLGKARARLTSPKWLKSAISGRARGLVDSFTSFAPSIIEREVAGEEHWFYLGNVTGRRWYGYHTDACQEMRFLKSHLIEPGAIVFECGGHHGAHTILLSRWVGSSGKVVVVEPIPENVAILKRNLELNHLANVVVRDAAVGSNCGSLFVTPNSNGAVTTRRGSTIQVDAITLDALSDELGLVPGLVSIDVEGYEYKVLEGCEKLLSTVPRLFIEIHTLTLARYGSKFEDLWKMVDRSLYDIFILFEESGEPVPYFPYTTPKDRVHLFFKPK